MIQTFWDADFGVKTFFPRVIDGVGLDTHSLTVNDTTGQDIELVTATAGQLVVPLVRIVPATSGALVYVAVRKAGDVAFGNHFLHMSTAADLPVQGCDAINVKSTSGSLRVSVILFALT